MFRLHLRYLLSRFNIITILVIIGLYIGSLIINLFSIPVELSTDLSKEMYFYNLILIVKLVVILLIVFLFSITALNSNDSYQLYLLNKRRDRIKYYITKTGALILISSIIIIIFFMCFVLFGLVLTDWYIIEIDHIKFFLYLFLISIMYGLLAYNLVKLLNSLIVILIPCLIVILEEAFINEKIIKDLSYLFPIIENNEQISLSYGFIHVVILLCCYFILGLIRSYTIDIK